MQVAAAVVAAPEVIVRILIQAVPVQRIRVMQAVAEVLFHGLPLTRAEVAVAPEQ